MPSSKASVVWSSALRAPWEVFTPEAVVIWILSCGTDKLKTSSADSGGDGAPVVLVRDVRGVRDPRVTAGRAMTG
jgi:hypothetical protein